MPGAKVFLDTNILLYLLSADQVKADRAEDLIASGSTISVQVLNEFTAVARRKLNFSWAEILEVLGPIRALCRVEAMTIETHDTAIDIAQRYGFSIYDGTIIATALISGCEILYSEDMQDRQVIENHLTICKPFRP